MTRNSRTLLSNILLLALFVPFTLHAQEAATWKATAKPAAAKQGEKVTVTVSADINGEWHIYSMTPMDEGPVATSITYPAGGPLRMAGKPKQPKPIVKFDEAFGIDTEFYEKKVDFTLPTAIAADAKLGRQKVVLQVEYMACNDRMCLPPKTVDVPLTIEILPGDAATLGEAAKEDSAAAAAAPAEQTLTQAPAEKKGDSPAEEESLGYGDERDIERARKEGIWAYIGLAMSVGALALLTPCVFPMIPITVSFFTKREAATRGRSIRDAFIYSMGIIFTFTGLGIVLALTLGASGINQFAASPWINLLITAVFVLFALNLFGMFEIVIPSSILTKLTVASGEGQGIGSLLLMGLTFTLTSFTCTVPFVGTVMVAAAQGEIWWSVLGMLAFSSVFALPFFLLALFPSWLKSMPKSGGWLNSVKVVMGFLELAAAMKFISNVDLIWGLGWLSRDVFLSFWVGIGLMTTLYLIGKFQLPHDTKVERLGVFRMLSGVFFLGVSVYLYTGIGGKPLGELDAFLPPVNYSNVIEAAGGSASAAPVPGGVNPAAHEEIWLSNFDEALVVAKKEGKPIFVDFTGFACTNCRWMEANVFPRPDVQARLKDYVLVRLYTDGQGEVYLRNRALQEQRFGTVALPLYVTISPEDEVLATFPGLTRKPQEFVDFLDKALKTPGAATQAGM